MFKCLAQFFFVEIARHLCSRGTRFEALRQLVEQHYTHWQPTRMLGAATVSARSFSKVNWSFYFRSLRLHSFLLARETKMDKKLRQCFHPKTYIYWLVQRKIQKKLKFPKNQRDTLSSCIFMYLGSATGVEDVSFRSTAFRSFTGRLFIGTTPRFSVTETLIDLRSSNS